MQDMKKLKIGLSNGVEVTKRFESQQKTQDTYDWFLKIIQEDNPENLVALDNHAFRVKLIVYLEMNIDDEEL